VDSDDSDDDSTTTTTSSSGSDSNSNSNNSDSDDSRDDDDDDDINNESNYDRVDVSELDDLAAESDNSSVIPEPASPVTLDSPTVSTVDHEDSDSIVREDTRDPVRMSSSDRTCPNKYTHAQLQECQGKEQGSKECRRAVQFSGLPPEKLEQCHNIMANSDSPDVKEIQYNPELAKAMAQFIIEINEGATKHGASFAQNYILQKGLKKFGQAGSDATS
jgi:hypothetical protein